MITLIKNDDVNNYKLYSSSAIINNINQLKFDSNKSYNNYTKIFGTYNNWPRTNNASYGYALYNVFQLTSGSKAYCDILKDLRQVIFEYLVDNHYSTDYVWFQSWLNYHKQDEVFGWHKHFESTCHGYIAVDPKNTVTEFKNFEIENKMGQIYIGPIGIEHRVVVKEPYIGQRITLGFDVVIGEINSDTKNLGWIPLIY